MTNFYFVAASEKFLTIEEPLEEILKERNRNYGENNKEKDFWLIKQPNFLNDPSLKEIAKKVPRPSAAVISTDKKFIDFLKLRLEFVVNGQFQSPNDFSNDPFAVE